MSRNIVISYVDAATGQEVPIDVPAPYFLFGTQRPSMRFWSIPRIKDVGVERLAILGHSDPVWFAGWDDLAILNREIALLGQHLEEFDFYPESKAEWLSHLTYCYHLLRETAPKDAEPRFEIG
jgi:hypothetical protein